jgi:hypothetical protein
MRRLRVAQQPVQRPQAVLLEQPVQHRLRWHEALVAAAHVLATVWQRPVCPGCKQTLDQPCTRVRITSLVWREHPHVFRFTSWVRSSMLAEHGCALPHMRAVARIGAFFAACADEHGAQLAWRLQGSARVTPP